MKKITFREQSVQTFIKLFCFMGLLMGFSQVQAQVSYLEFSHTQKTFTALQSPTIVATATGATGAASLDEVVYTLPASAIPFNFNFEGENYTTLKIATNGYVFFGDLNTITEKPISAANAYKGVIAAAGVDLNSLFQMEGKTGQIAYKVLGEAPNRTFVIEYLHFRPYLASTNTDTYYDWNFQIHLLENNSIEIIYDLKAKGTPSSAIPQVGIRGGANTNFNSRTASGTATSNWLTSAAATSNTAGITVNTLTLPPSGYAYKWTKTNFCLPKYEYSGSTDADPIMRVVFNTIDNTSSSTVGQTAMYENFTHINTDVNKGQSYEISVKGPSSTFPSDVMLYIDFNQNGLFDDPGEAFYIGRLAAQNPFNALTITSQITIPTTALNGTTKMRLVKNTNVPAYSNPNAPNSISGPCAQNLRTGQVEEYSVNILQGTVTPPVIQSVVVTTQNNVAAQINTVNGTLPLVATVNPSTVGQNVTWSVVAGNTNATVSPTGVVTGIASGTATIRATSALDVTKYGELVVTINVPIVVQSVVVATQNNVPAKINTLNGTLPLVATVNPNNANQNVTWSVTAGAANASVSATGVVTAIANGTATIRATSVADATKYGELVVTINEIIPVQSVVVKTQNNVEAKITTLNGVLQLVATVNPNNASQTVTWSVVSGEAFASVTSSGVVTSIASGIAKIRATSLADTTKYGEIEVEVALASAAIDDFVKQHLTVYPNPTTDLLNFESDLNLKQIELFDLTGKLILKTAQTQLNVTHLAAGMYQVKVTFDDARTGFIKIIKK